MTNADRLTESKRQWNAQLGPGHNQSFAIWLLDRAEAAEARAAQLEAECDELRAENAALQRQVEQYQRLVGNTLAGMDNIIRGA